MIGWFGWFGTLVGNEGENTTLTFSAAASRSAGVVALGEAEAGEIVDPWTNQIARASSSTAAITPKVTVSATPNS